MNRWNLLLHRKRAKEGRSHTHDRASGERENTWERWGEGRKKEEGREGGRSIKIAPGLPWWRSG